MVNFIISLMFTIAIGGLVGGVISLCIVYIYNDPVLLNLMKGIFSGIIIGALTHLSFAFSFLKLKVKLIFSFFLTFIVIGGGTFLAAYLSGVVKPITFIVTIITAEVVGIAITFILYRYSIWKAK
ncbi:MAG: hypothetical protein ACP5QT_06665 [Brevinematia bacterium]